MGAEQYKQANERIIQMMNTGDMSGLDELLAAARRFKVEFNAPLLAIERPEPERAVRVRKITDKRADAARARPTGRLDQHNICPELTQDLATKLAAFVGQVQDPEMSKHRSLSSLNSYIAALQAGEDRRQRYKAEAGCQAIVAAGQASCESCFTQPTTPVGAPRLDPSLKRPDV